MTDTATMSTTNFGSRTCAIRTLSRIRIRAKPPRDEEPHGNENRSQYCFHPGHPNPNPGPSRKYFPGPTLSLYFPTPVPRQKMGRGHVGYSREAQTSGPCSGHAFHGSNSYPVQSAALPHGKGG